MYTRYLVGTQVEMRSLDVSFLRYLPLKFWTSLNRGSDDSLSGRLDTILILPFLIYSVFCCHWASTNNWHWILPLHNFVDHQGTRCFEMSEIFHCTQDRKLQDLVPENKLDLRTPEVCAHKTFASNLQALGLTHPCKCNIYVTSFFLARLSGLSPTRCAVKEKHTFKIWASVERSCELYAVTTQKVSLTITQVLFTIRYIKYTTRI